MKALYRGAERLMSMDDTAWARHANPLSAYSRFTILPLLSLAIWSRVWLGWGVVALVILVLIWTWVNPRLFPPPKSLDNWASRGVLGERVFLNRRNDVAAHHRAWADRLSLGSLPGAVVLVIGLIWLWPWWVIFGIALTVLPKVWFVDRMVWLYADWLRDNNKELGDV
ncbi:MAG: DUF6653 family protein [Pseudomonadota bacterium]